MKSNNKNKKYVFLTYISRSGSTFLASLLDSAPNIGMSLEAGFPDDICRGKIGLNQPEDVDSFLDKLYSIEKFVQWDIPRAFLEKEIPKLSFPVSFSKLLTLIFEKTFQQENVDIFIYKMAHYIYHLEALRNEFPEGKILFIMRDPRAIYNSQKTSINSVNGLPMSDNPIHVAAAFNKVCSVIETVQEEEWFHCIRYEDLLLDNDSVLSGIFSFLDVKLVSKFKSSNSFNDRIPEAQKHLHINVGRPPQKERIYAWRDKLSTYELCIIELLCFNRMHRWGYEIVTFKVKNIPEKIDSETCTARQ